MPNYKECRFCSTKFLPIADEMICPKCKAEVLNAVRYEAFGEPILVGTMSDPVIDAMKQAVADANPEIKPIIETIVGAVAPIMAEAKVIGVPPEVPEPVLPEIVVVEEVLEELDKGEEAVIVKDEIIAPAAPKPEEKPNAPS